MKNQTSSGSNIRRRKRLTVITKSNDRCKNAIKDVRIDMNKTVGPRLIRRISSSEWTLFLSLLAFRLINAFLIQTSFVPDEHWQSVEVAHQLAFGYGYLTWEWKAAIRSPIYPMMFALVFKVLAIFGLDSRLMIIKVPLLLMGCLAAVADISLYRFSYRLSGQSTAQYALLSQLVNWFTIFTAPRTITNSLEWALTIIALSYFPSPRDRLQSVHMKEEHYFIGLVSICIFLRPTAVVQWSPLCLWHLYIGWQSFRLRRQLLLYFFIGVSCLIISSVVEKHFYGRWTFSQINFVQLNIFADVAKLYGTHPWHWYWTQGWPALLGVQFPLFLSSCFVLRKELSDRMVILTILWSIYVYSFSAHKEFRFLFPLLPMALHLCGKMLNSLSSQWRKLSITLIITTHIPLSLYVCLVHQRGSLDVMSAIGREVERGIKSSNSSVPKSILFLTPCHATPYFSHIHFNLSMRFLTCEPNLNGSVSYMEEQNIFFTNPIRWLETFYRLGEARPDRIVLYDRLYNNIPLENYLTKFWKYRVCGQFFHSHFTKNYSRHGKYFLLLCK